ncbi:MAG: methyltransferase domain-containing protein [Isosphaeraceae bacterium]
MNKSTPEQIRDRFDRDVERFANLDTGQTATVDAPLVMDLMTKGAAALNPGAVSVLDVGCGAGNYTLRLLEHRPGLDVTLLDLSRPMLDRAAARVSAQTKGRVETVQADVREVDFPEAQFDLILAAMVLHHLRTEAEWRAVFEKFHRWLKPGGSLWIADLVAHSISAVQALMWQRYGDYLTTFKGETYRDHVFAYIEQEDTPRPLVEQLDWLRQAGFAQVDVLHKNSSFAAFCGLKSNGATV